jgi:hypothetical protein
MLRDRLRVGMSWRWLGETEIFLIGNSILQSSDFKMFLNENLLVVDRSGRARFDRLKHIFCTRYVLCVT